MLGELAAQYRAERIARLGAQPALVDRKIKLYQDALDDKDPTFPEIAFDSNYRKSYQTALDLHKSGALDGTKTTYICAGEVIKLNPEDKLPKYTIVDQPAKQNYWLRAAAGPSR